MAITIDDVYKHLSGIVPNNQIGFLQQYQSANKALDYLNSDEVSSVEGLDDLRDMFDSSKTSAIAGGAVSLLSGASALASQTADAAQLADTSKYERQLAAMADGRNQNFYNNSSVLSYAGNQPRGFKISQADLNPTIGQTIGKIATGALTGASTGLAVGGPWGAAAGAIAGGVLPAIGDAFARKGNEYKADIINLKQNQQKSLNNLAMVSGASQAHDYTFGNAWATRKAMGGGIDRSAIHDYIARSAKRPRRNSSQSVGKVTRTHVDGGTRITIKR